MVLVFQYRWRHRTALEKAIGNQVRFRHTIQAGIKWQYYKILAIQYCEWMQLKTAFMDVGLGIDYYCHTRIPLIFRYQVDLIKGKRTPFDMQMAD